MVKHVFTSIILLFSLTASASAIDTLSYWTVIVNNDTLTQSSIFQSHEPTIHIGKYTDTDVVAFHFFAGCLPGYTPLKLTLKDSSSKYLLEKRNDHATETNVSAYHTDKNKITLSIGVLKSLFIQHKLSSIFIYDGIIGANDTENTRLLFVIRND